MDKLETLEGVLSGAALAAAAGFAREGDETQRKIWIARDDSTRALREIEELNTRADVVRARMPVVMDFDAGLSIANQPNPVPSVTPSAAGVVRPDLAMNMSTAIADLKWPPKPGQYDERGNILTIGELTALASALTYEELRAFLQGLVQSRQPTAAQKMQIFLAANGLTTALYGLNLSGDQHVQAWKSFFAGGAGGAGGATGTPETDPHGLVTSPPVANVVDPGITSVVPLGLPSIPALQYAHQNTDRASKWRVFVGAGVAVGGTAFQVTFGTSPWVKNGKPYQPVVLSSSPVFVVSNVTSNGFTVKTAQGLTGASTLDVSFAVCD
jgi:hypothetical protein